MPVEHTSHGVPLEEYVLTRGDHNDQKVAEQIRDHVEKLELARHAEEAADTDLRERRIQSGVKAWQIILRNKPADHELMRWRLRLYCGHIVESRRHVTIESPIMHGSSSARCTECGMDPARIVAWEPIGLKGQPPGSDLSSKGDALSGISASHAGRGEQAPARPASPPGARTFTVPQVAEALQVPNKTVYTLIKAGQLAALRVGRSYRIPDAEFDRYLASATNSTKPRQS